ncbi:PREDICTED: ubiquitin-like domain-containing CTD phosphatase isoform X2 [Ipomoea nil]|uniref:ubiquitin-like domain-containing CTD phosphatase isoform X2 n=1 Tax=Ipomoea nil TaxID=35883 RepID=UPI0009019149|nr:PREDICTED: ubiquitin-like domain-containing CTD phosphatase isoform X2 [Ipomoea nil]
MGCRLCVHREENKFQTNNIMSRRGASMSSHLPEKEKLQSDDDDDEAIRRTKKIIVPAKVRPACENDLRMGRSDNRELERRRMSCSIVSSWLSTFELDQVDCPDDFEIGQDEGVEMKDKDTNKKILRRRIEEYKITVQNPCREGKKLLVLDIDYTLIDHKSAAENPYQLMRPSVYAEYDIIIWSATSMDVIEHKMEQFGILNNPNYKITAMLDHLAMITVQSDTHGMINCKPLGLIWAKFPEFYNPKNTIMFDDLRRNFAMNPQNGLTIKPFRRAHSSRSTDQELMKLTRYLLAIADLDDLSALNHKDWESYKEDDLKRGIRASQRHQYFTRLGITIPFWGTYMSYLFLLCLPLFSNISRH